MFRNSIEDRRKIYPIFGINMFDVAYFLERNEMSDGDSMDREIETYKPEQIERIAYLMSEYLCENGSYDDALMFAVEQVLNKRNPNEQ